MASDKECPPRPLDHLYEAFVRAAHVEREDQLFHIFREALSGLYEGDDLTFWLVRAGSLHPAPGEGAAPQKIPYAAAQAATAGRPVRLLHAGRTSSGEGCPAQLAAPLVTGGRTLGVVALQSEQAGRYTEADERAVGTAALHLAAHLQAHVQIDRRRRAMRDMISTLSDMVEAKDDYTEAHCQHIAEMSLALGMRLGISGQRLEVLNDAAVLHDIGKVAVPDEILHKPGRLSPEEYEIMKGHCSHGRRILERSGFLQDEALIVEQHHERYDGTGYPNGLRGEEILLEARIIALADAFDAMSSTRPYRMALRRDQVMQEIRTGSGSQFDPKVVAVFLDYVGR